MQKLWRTKTEFVDLETGEVIHKEVAQAKYVVVNTIKTVSHANKQYAGTVQYRKECRRIEYSQQRIDFPE